MQKFKELINNKNIIRAMLIGYLAAFVFVLFAFTVKSVPTETADERAAEESVSREGFKYSRPKSSLKEISAEEDTEEFVPAPDKLNLAYFFPDGADTSDSINSYAGKIYTSMNSKNASYFASYFDLTDSTPKSIAASYGLGTDRVMGKYNPNDASQSESDPSTWTVNSFRNINVSFYDGDGNRISGYYNVQEIMALASVYAYYHEMDDYEAMQAYCEQLFDASVSAKVSLGNVYYDSGCLNRTVEQEASEAIALEKAQTQLEGGSNVNVSASASDTEADSSEYVTIQVSESESYTHDYAVANGDLSQTRTAASHEGETTLSPYAEQSSAVIYDYTTAAPQYSDSQGSSGTSSGSSDKHGWRSIHENVVVSPGTAETTAAPEAEGAADTGSADASGSSDASDTTVVGDANILSGADIYMNSKAAVSLAKADNATANVTDGTEYAALSASANARSAKAKSGSIISSFADSLGLSLSVYAKKADSAETMAPILVCDAASNMFDNVVVSPAEGAAISETAAADTQQAQDSAAGSNTAVSDTAAQDAAVQTQNSAASDTAAAGGQSSQGTSTDAGNTNASGNTSGSAEAGSEDGTDGASLVTGDTEGTDAESTEASSTTGSSSYCPGHIDLYVSITIDGIDDSNSLFKVDPIGNNSDNFNDEWQGWTEDKIALAKSLCEQDWLENYGLSISSIKIADSLTSDEINNYLNSLAPEVSQARRDIVEYALNSVGKIPYYWGGKPAGPGYTNNGFYTLISPDYRGRILKGLDCSGWINWVYWSVTGHSLAGESTGTLIGCGRKISRSELQPGDIIIRTGSDAHVVMFLCWAQNGNFIGIHETGGVINNVVVSEMTASWPYYRSLID